MKHEIEHGLERPVTKQAVDKAMEAYSERFAKYDPKFEWKSEYIGLVSFSAKGVKVGGEIEITDSKILIDLSVPLLLRVFKGKAIEVIDREVRVWVDKAKKGEL